jgi:hypothetical protein
MINLPSFLRVGLQRYGKYFYLPNIFSFLPLFFQYPLFSSGFSLKAGAKVVGLLITSKYFYPYFMLKNTYNNKNIDNKRII